mmetsp:Transcript_44005/g.86873  ORF Transcript_44005/g.86873 Transcript_44005/m.86873 type:complete len:84 (+) Transcript_44005:861-1112(+)
MAQQGVSTWNEPEGSLPIRNLFSRVRDWRDFEGLFDGGSRGAEGRRCREQSSKRRRDEGKRDVQPSASTVFLFTDISLTARRP